MVGCQGAVQIVIAPIMTGMHDRQSSCLSAMAAIPEMYTHVGTLVGRPADRPCEQIDGDTSHEPARNQEGDTIQRTVSEPFDDPRSESCNRTVTNLSSATAPHQVTHVNSASHEEVNIGLDIRYRFFDLINL